MGDALLHPDRLCLWYAAWDRAGRRHRPFARPSTVRSCRGSRFSNDPDPGDRADGDCHARGAVGLKGLVPKAIISTYLSFFPVAVGMVKGLRSPDPIHLDLMRTYSASRAQVFPPVRFSAWYAPGLMRAAVPF